MKFSIESAELQNLFGAMNTLVDEATIEVTETGMSFRGMDPSHIGLLDVQYPVSAEGSAKFGIRVDEANKMIKRFKGGQIELSTTEDSHLQIRGDGKSYKLRLIEASASSTPLPKLEFKAKVELRTIELLDKALGDIQTVSDYVTLESKNGFFDLSGRGDSGEVFLSITRQLDIKNEIKEESKATYSLDYLSKMVKAIKTDKPVVIEYSSKMPIRLSFEDGRIAFYLAPRVQD